MRRARHVWVFCEGSAGEGLGLLRKEEKKESLQTAAEEEEKRLRREAKRRCVYVQSRGRE